MSGKVVFLDWSKRIYVANVKDYDELLRKHPHLMCKICQVVTFYESDNYVELAQQLLDNGVFKE